MKIYIRPALFTMLSLLVLQAWAQPSRDENPSVAYSYKGVLYLTRESGRVLRAVKTTLPIGEFAVSHDGKLVIFSPPRSAKLTGGPLCILNIATGVLERVPSDPFYNDRPGRKRIEFYADPEFAPDDKSVVFAAHGRGTGDLVEKNGPFAIFDLATRHIRILKNSLGNDGFPIGFPYDPHWSTDGKQILLNYEGHSSITDAGGTTLTDLVIPENEISQSPLSYGMYSVGWLGPGCVLYEAGEDPDRDPARILNLSTGTTTSAADLLKLPEQSLRGILAFSGQHWVRRHGSRYRVDGPGVSWLIPGDSATTHVRILRKSSEDSIPDGCR
jgi:hypothetical protein